MKDTPAVEQINDIWYATNAGRMIQLLDQDQDFGDFTSARLKAYLLDMKTRLADIDPDHPDVEAIRKWYVPPDAEV